MAAPVESYQPCTGCGETARHAPLCPENLAFIETEAMELNHDTEQLAVRARTLKAHIAEVRIARLAQRQRARGSDRPDPHEIRATLRETPKRALWPPQGQPPEGEETKQFPLVGKDGYES